jgi:hypothetical protein
VRHAEAIQFVEWLQGGDAQLIIRDFGKDKYGETCSFQTRRRARSSDKRIAT